LRLQSLIDNDVAEFRVLEVIDDRSILALLSTELEL